MQKTGRLGVLICWCLAVKKGSEERVSYPMPVCPGWKGTVHSDTQGHIQNRPKPKDVGSGGACAAEVGGN